MNCPKFGFIFSEFAQFSDIYEFEDVTWYSGGYGFGETAREAIVDACKNAYQDCTLWNIPRNPAGYLVEFDEDGNTVNVERFASYARQPTRLSFLMITVRHSFMASN